jgi:ABC-2 type transport system ATP-binding protein
VLEVVDLGKRYGEVVALDGCSFHAGPGRIVGLLGPNGAGKTTVMRSIFGLVRPDSGEVRWNGHRVGPADWPRFGYLPEERGLYPRMRVHEQLTHFARLGGVSRADARAAADAWLARVQLADRADSRVDQLSHGNKQRLQLAVALVNDPALLVLDEPFNGLDPLGVASFGTILRDLAARGVAVLFSSHQLDLVEDLCEDVVTLNHGRVVLAGSLHSLRAQSPQRRVEIRFAAPPSEQIRWPDAGTSGDAAVSDSHEVVRLLVGRDTDPEQLLTAARSAGRVESFRFEPPSLSQLFLAAVAG